MASSRKTSRVELLQGTLDMLILKTLLFGPTHGRGIANYIRQTTADQLSVEHGSLYPALHRLERAGLIQGRWETRGEITTTCDHHLVHDHSEGVLHRSWAIARLAAGVE